MGGSTAGANYTPTVIGHRPKCALSALERFAEFPRQERLDSLRPHLVRYGLFPPKSDPETAPITMYELKGLVRIWKLHNERNFWRNNSTKDAIVLALHQHMQKKRQLERLKQEIVAKGRQKREEEKAQSHLLMHGHRSGKRSFADTPRELSDADSGVEPNRRSKPDILETNNHRRSKADMLPETSNLRRSKAELVTETNSLRWSKVDLLSPEKEPDEIVQKDEYVPAHEREPTPENPNQDCGMIYLSRGFAGTARRIDPRAPPKDLCGSPDEGNSVAAGVVDDGELTAVAVSGISNQRSSLVAATAPTPLRSSGDDVAKNDAAEQQQLLVKRKCSTALLNMSTSEAMQAQFVEQGGLSALLTLAMSCTDLEVVRNCAACLVNLIPYGDYYEPPRLLDAGVVRVLVRLATEQDPLVRHCCALCLCRLSAESGIEERLVTDGALVAATKLVHLSDKLATKVVAAKVLTNLAVTLEGNQAETLVKNVLKCVGNLVGHAQCDARTQQFCAEAIANLACLAVARPILAKQGVIATLKLLLTTSMSRQTTDACTAALCNMGQLHGCRKEMLAFGLIRIISTLLRTGQGETQHLCTLCLTTLSFQKDLRGALLREGALRTIASVVSKRGDPELTRNGAYALLNFAFDPQTREDVISEDGLPALMALLDVGDATVSVDEATRSNSLMALCNLLADQATCPQVIEAGVLSKLVAFTMHLSTVPGLHEYLSVALLNLSMHAELRKCVAQTDGSARLLIELVVLDKQQAVQQQRQQQLVEAAAALDPTLLLQKGLSRVSIPVGMSLTNLGTSLPVAEASYATNALKALFNLCLDSQSHRVILELNILESLQLLNNLYDTPPPPPSGKEPTRPGSRRKREKIIKQDLPPARSDDESCLHLSAMLIHVLSTNNENHKTMLNGGAVSLLVKTAASPNEKTKTAVAGSLYNLTQCAQVTNEDFLNALMALSHSSENVRVLWCAWCLANVSMYPKGRVMLGKLAKKLIPTLLAMMRSGCADAERIQYHCSVAMCNTMSVFLSKEDVLGMLKEGTVQDIIVITVLRANDVQTKQVLAQALFNLLTREDTRSALIKQDVPLALVRLTNKADSILNLLCVKMLFNLSCGGAELAPKLIEMKAVRTMVDQCLSPSGGVQIKRLCAATLGNLSRMPEMLNGLAARTNKIVAGIRSIAVVKDAESLEGIASVAFHLSTVEEGRQSLTKQEIVPVLTSLCDGADKTPVRVKQLVVASLGNLSCSPQSHKAITDTALPVLIETMRQPVHTFDTRMNACLAVCNLVAHYPPAREVAVRLDVLPALRHFVRAATSDEAFTALGKTVRDLTWYKEGLPILASQGAMALCVRLAKNEQVIIKHDIATAVCNLCSCHSAPAQIVEEGVINALFWLTLQDCLNLTRPIFRECAIAIRYLAQHDTLRPLVCMEDNLLPFLFRLSRFMECEETRFHAAVAVYYILGNEVSQKSMCRAGAVKLLNDLATTGPSIREVCSAALHQLPNELLNNIDGQLLSVLMSLLQMTNADFTDPTRYDPDRNCASENPWQLTPARYTYSKDMPKAQWPTFVISKSTSTFLAASYNLEPYAGEQVNPSRARGANELIGRYSKMFHPCSQLTSSNLDDAAFNETTAVDGVSDRSSDEISDDERQTDQRMNINEVALSPVSSHYMAALLAPERAAPDVGSVKAEDARRDTSEADSTTFPAIHKDDKKFLSPSAVSASEALQQASVAGAFTSTAVSFSCSADVRPSGSKDRLKSPLKQTSVGLDETRKTEQRKCGGARRKYTVSKASRKRNKIAMTLRAAKQQDRIADDYYELLRHVT